MSFVLVLVPSEGSFYPVFEALFKRAEHDRLYVVEVGDEEGKL